MIDWWCIILVEAGNSQQSAGFVQEGPGDMMSRDVSPKHARVRKVLLSLRGDG